MKNPYITCNGHTYERNSIEEWLKNNNTDPLTNEVLDIKNISPNIFAKKQIDEWRENHKN